MNQRFIEKLFQSHRNAERIPSPSKVCNLVDGLLSILFPELSNQRYQNLRAFEQYYQSTKLELFNILHIMRDNLPAEPEELEAAYLASLPFVHRMLMEDANAILKGDPAAVDLTEVIRTYPGFFAIAVYRLAHEFYKLDIPLIPRILTEHAHSKTGIDIHPGAQIDTSFCIDHGTGIVIGETVVIGKNVKLYQGVTLGALSVKKEMAQTKRHPTIEDRVIIYSGATILGGQTVIGHDSIIGGNVWLTKSVLPNSRVYYDGQIKQKQLQNISSL